MRPVVLALGISLALAACKKQQATLPSVPDTQPSSFARQDFITVSGNSQIALISATQCEISGGGQILLGDYQRQGSSLRIVLKAMGTDVVEYFDIVPNGLHDRQSGEILMTPAAANLERARLSRENEERRQAQIAAEQARENAEREKAAALEKARADIRMRFDARLTALMQKGNVFRIVFNGDAPYELRITKAPERDGGERSDVNRIVSISADAVLVAKRSRDGKMVLINLVSGGRGFETLVARITLRYRPGLIQEGETPSAQVSLAYWEHPSDSTEFSGGIVSEDDKKVLLYAGSLSAELDIVPVTVQTATSVQDGSDSTGPSSDSATPSASPRYSPVQGFRQDRQGQAEEALNSVYIQVRAKLGQSAKEKLKQQQLQWLKERQDIAQRSTDPDATIVFTENRVRELQRSLNQ